MEFHEIANAFPLITGKEYDDFCADIASNGLIQPIVLYEGKVLEGRNRHNACMRTGVELRTIDLEPGKDPVKFVISANVHRRHMNQPQLAAAGAKLANLTKGGDRRSENFKGPIGLLKQDQSLITQEKAAKKLLQAVRDNALISQADAAEQLGTSTRSIKRAKAVMKEDPETFQQLENGEISVNAAVKKVKEKKERKVKELTTLLPGQGVRIPEKRIQKNKIVAAIETGKNLPAVAQEVAEADSIDLDDQHILSLIDWLKESIKARTSMKRALEAHHKKRVQNGS